MFQAGFQAPTPAATRPRATGAALQPQPETIRRFAEDLGLDTATGPTGTVVFFDCNTLHGSNGNITPDPRSNAFFVYNALSNRVKAPYAAPDPRPDFLANRETPEAIRTLSGKLTG